jgi:hypothetical protein
MLAPMKNGVWLKNASSVGAKVNLNDADYVHVEFCLSSLIYMLG